MAENSLRLTVPEIIGLADRMMARGHSLLLRDQPELQRDCRLCGRLLANFFLNNQINDTIVLENGGR